MASRDAQRTWFSEMVEELRRRWRTDLSFTELIGLRDEFDAMLHRIRSARQIQTPVIRCRRSGYVGPAAEPDVSVRSMIIALGRFGIASGEEAKTLEKRWAAHRKTPSTCTASTGGPMAHTRTAARRWHLLGAAETLTFDEESLLCHLDDSTVPVHITVICGHASSPWRRKQQEYLLWSHKHESCHHPRERTRALAGLSVKPLAAFSPRRKGGERFFSFFMANIRKPAQTC